MSVLVASVVSNLLWLVFPPYQFCLLSDSRYIFFLNGRTTKQRFGRLPCKGYAPNEEAFNNPRFLYARMSG